MHVPVGIVVQVPADPHVAVKLPLVEYPDAHPAVQDEPDAWFVTHPPATPFVGSVGREAQLTLQTPDGGVFHTAAVQVTLILPDTV